MPMEKGNLVQLPCKTLCSRYNMEIQVIDASTEFFSAILPAYCFAKFVFLGAFKNNMSIFEGFALQEILV